jgi:hypothetical protein
MPINVPRTRPPGPPWCRGGGRAPSASSGGTYADNGRARQMAASGALACWAWIGSGLYLYSSSRETSVFSLSALAFLVVGMFAAAIVIGGGAYLAQRAAGKALVYVVGNPSRLVTVLISGLGVLMFAAEVWVCFRVATWVFHQVA